MYVQCYTMARSRNHWCHGDATVRFLFTAIGVAVAVNNISVLCCHENATVGSLYTVVEQQNISCCCHESKY